MMSDNIPTRSIWRLSSIASVAAIAALAAVVLVTLALLVSIARIPPGHLGVVYSRAGNELPAGQILAAKGQKGIREEFLTPGWHLKNAAVVDVEVHPEILIPPGMVGIQTSLVGKPLAPGQLLAEAGEKGVLRELLTPGRYRIHPMARKVDLVPAVTIPAGSAGVQVALTGTLPPDGQILAGAGERGVRSSLLPPGMHFINPYEFDIIQMDIRTQRYDMVDEDAVQFPSKDGFEIEINIIIEWSVDRDRVPEVVASIGVNDDIIDKIIRPNARSISRTEGSKYRAKDFIVGSGRESFQEAFFDALASIAEPKGVDIQRALVLKVSVPSEIAAPIKDTVIALEEDLRNKQRIETAKSAAQLALEESLAHQYTRKVEAHTQSVERRIAAEALANEALIRAKQEVQVARFNLNASSINAQSVLKMGEAEAEVIRLQREAEAAGLAAAVRAFGSGRDYAMYRFAAELAPSVQVVFAPVGEGTLWTSLDEFLALNVPSTDAPKQPAKK